MNTAPCEPLCFVFMDPGSPAFERVKDFPFGADVIHSR